VKKWVPKAKRERNVAVKKKSVKLTKGPTLKKK
jgi:hypothetical protein